MVNIKDTFDGKNGIKLEYYKNGEVKKTIPYINGKKHGIERHYFGNGNVEKEITYVLGKSDGTQKDYDLNGYLMNEIVSLANGITISRSYHRNGNLSSEVSYKYNLREGPAYHFYNSGILECVSTFKRDKLYGLQTWFLRDGSFSHVVNYNN